VRMAPTVMAASIVKQVAPKYPSKAKKDHVEGTVVMHAIIGKDGSIKDLKVMSGPDVLVASSEKAVKQWKYKPTLLLGNPVEVDTTISVVYELGH
jgi:protein TonB